MSDQQEPFRVGVGLTDDQPEANKRMIEIISMMFAGYELEDVLGILSTLQLRALHMIASGDRQLNIEEVIDKMAVAHKQAWVMTNQLQKAKQGATEQ